MKRHPRLDKNHASIVKGLREAGVSVQSLASIGNGCPDLLCAVHGVNYCFEVKDGSKPPSKRELTSDELDWITNWRGQVSVVTCLDDALKIMNLL